MTPNAIERLRAAYFADEECIHTFPEDLAAVDALYQAAKDVSGMFPPRTRFGMTPGLIALAAAVRRVEGEDEPPVSPFHTEPVPS